MEEDVSKDGEEENTSDPAGPEAELRPRTAQEPGAGAPASPPQPDYKDLYLRAAAELENFRRRTERERTALVQFAAEGVMRRLLDPLDSFDRAIRELERLEAASPPEVRGQFAGSLEGMRALRRQLGDVLAAEGVELIEAQGARFDPELHEALVRVPGGEVPEGTVVEVLQRGYTLRGKLLRPARVAVSAGPSLSGAADAEAASARGAQDGKRSGSHDSTQSK